MREYDSLLISRLIYSGWEKEPPLLRERRRKDYVVRIFREWNHSHLSLLARRTTRSTLDQPAADLSRFQYLDTACRSRHARDLLASTPNFCASLARSGIIVGLFIPVYSKASRVTSVIRRRDK